MTNPTLNAKDERELRTQIQDLLKEREQLKAQVAYEHSERLRLDALRASLVAESEARLAGSNEARLVNEVLDSSSVPRSIERADQPTVELRTYERVKILIEQRDKARADYQFMVDRAMDEKLDGYRELGARAAAAENELDDVRRCLRESIEVIELILETDSLRGHAFEPDDDNYSIYDACKKTIEHSKQLR